MEFSEIQLLNDLHFMYKYVNTFVLYACYNFLSAEIDILNKFGILMYDQHDVSHQKLYFLKTEVLM